MPLDKSLPCPKCGQALTVVFDKQDKLNKCDCLFCGWSGLLKNLAGLLKNLAGHYKTNKDLK